MSIAAVDLDDPQHKVMTYNAGSGGAWGRRGAVIDSTGAAFSTTGDGVYDPTSDPPRYANSVIGVQIVERRAASSRTTTRRPTGTGCASAIWIPTTRRRFSPTRDAS